MGMIYAVFAGSNYYPSGGWNDFIGLSATKEEALTKAANANCDWWHIVDLVSGKIVADGKRW